MHPNLSALLQAHYARQNYGHTVFNAKLPAERRAPTPPPPDPPHAYSNAGYDAVGYNTAGYNHTGYNSSGYTNAGYSTGGSDRGRYDRGGYDAAAYSAGRYDDDERSVRVDDDDDYDDRRHSAPHYRVSGRARTLHCALCLSVCLSVWYPPPKRL